ncbi:MAG: hypothetical protein U5O16_29860 [Rhodococcus sp. (in: high G+C Gram-positive bacteria)]|nr:hypothetical protein [Rhodococcus sp. (in: high G+C Gram-positive bacteria)]
MELAVRLLVIGSLTTVVIAMTLLRRADRAMYSAKARGGHSVVLQTETD